MRRFLPAALLFYLCMLFLITTAGQVDFDFSSRAYANVTPDSNVTSNTSLNLTEKQVVPVKSRGGWVLGIVIVVVLLLAALSYKFAPYFAKLLSERRHFLGVRRPYKDFSINYKRENISSFNSADHQSVSRMNTQNKSMLLEQRSVSFPLKANRPSDDFTNNQGRENIGSSALADRRPDARTVELPPVEQKAAQSAERTKSIMADTTTNFYDSASIPKYLKKILEKLHQLSNDGKEYTDATVVIRKQLEEQSMIVGCLKDEIEGKFKTVNIAMESIKTAVSDVEKSILEDCTFRAHEALKATMVKCINVKNQLTTSIDRQLSNILTAIQIAASESKNESFRNAMEKLISDFSSESEYPVISRYTKAISLLVVAEQQLTGIQEVLRKANFSEIVEAKSTVEEICADLEKMKESISHGVVIDSQEVASLYDCLIKEVGAAYRDAITAWGSDTVAEEIAILKVVLAKLDLELIDIEIGKTVPDVRLHEIGPSVTNSRYPSGVIVNVPKMGYIDKNSNTTIKAQVVVNR